MASTIIVRNLRLLSLFNLDLRAAPFFASEDDACLRGEAQPHITAP
jgi:hypothetical protein